MVTVKEKKAVENVELPASEIESNFGTDSFELVEPTEPIDIEKKKRTPRQSKKSESERAIDEVKALIALKLSVQRGRKDVANVKPLLEKLFSNEDITEEEGEQLLSQIDSLGSYVKLKQEYRAARENARPALKMFEEAGLSEDDAPTLE
jgi:aminopeptidase N